MPPTIRLTAIGWRARAALEATGGVARVVAALTASTYMDASGEVIWLGPHDSALHPRAMLALAIPFLDSATVVVEANHLEPWRPPRIAGQGVACLSPSAIDVLAALRRRDWIEGQPGGLGVLLVGRKPDFPLDGALGAVSAVARACDRGSPAGLEAAAIPLLGLGPGLTPAGDDFVGGVLFAQAILRRADPGWAAAAARLVEAARDRTHRISAALLTDLAAGEGHEPLHDLVAALSERAQDQARRAVARLARLGHSSGWDMLAGVLIGLAGQAALADGGP